MAWGRRARLGWACRALLCVSGAVVLAAPASAQDDHPVPGAPPDEAAAPVDPQRLALAREYVRESHVDAALRGAFANLARRMPQMSPDNATDAKARRFVSSFSVGMDAAVPMLTDIVTQTAARVFTTEELKALVDFYGSPSGQAMVAKTPMMMQQIMPQMFAIMPKVYAIAESDFCRRETCTEADRAMFKRLESSPPARPPQPQ